jgi:hypothetical protein
MQANEKRVIGDAVWCFAGGLRSHLAVAVKKTKISDLTSTSCNREEGLSYKAQ